MKRPPSHIYGLLAEFETPHQLAAAAWAARSQGYRRLDAFSPFAIEEVSNALDFRTTRVPLVVLIGGILGGMGGFLLQYWVSTIAYPVNVGGRPLNSWVAFIVITFECTILGAALSAVFGMLALNGLPEPYHPLFNVPGFARVTKDSFFLVIESTDPLFDSQRTREFLSVLNPRMIAEVPD
jgi:hypothetical protein